MTHNILACDPGVSGGFASLTHGVTEPRLASMPEKDSDIVELIRWTCNGDTTVFIEQVSGFIGKAHPGSRMFTFGHNAGLIAGAALGLGLAVRLVRPQEWQKFHKFPTVKKRDERKRMFKAKGEELYPNLKVTLSTADALLILDFAINKNATELAKL